MATDTFSIKRRDTLPVLRGTLYADDALTIPVDLTNAQTVRCIIGRVGEPPILDKSMSVIDDVNGRVEVQFTIAETDKDPDSYSMEFEVVWTNGDVSTYPKMEYLTFTVIADLDAPS